MLIRFLTPIHLCGLFLFTLQLSAVPDLVSNLQVKTYYICPHMKVRVQKGNPCPCGHRHKSPKKIAVLVDADDVCASPDDDIARMPNFDRFGGMFLQFSVMAPHLFTVPIAIVDPLYRSIRIEITPPPPRSVAA